MRGATASPCISEVQAAQAASAPISPSASEGTPPRGDAKCSPHSGPRKSAKRRATEALLARRFGSAEAAPAPPPRGAAACGCSATPAAKRQRLDRPPVRVPSCSDCCGGISRGPHPQQQQQGKPAWCGTDVSLPPLDWGAVMQVVGQQEELLLDPAAPHLYQLPGGVRVRVITRPEQLPGALRELRASMADSCIAVDLEWRPEGWAGGAATTRVALMQLASSSLVLLVRTCRLGYNLPPSLQQFLSDPEITLVGYSWDCADEAKAAATFGRGRAALFGRFLDLQRVSEDLGYHGFGLGALTSQVLGFMPPKDRKVTMSNWEAWQLTPRQIQYAALDALITGSVYRGLRLWHASPSACTSCRHMLGEAMPLTAWLCLDCDRSFPGFSGMHSHVRQKGHRGSMHQCSECGRHVNQK